MKYVSTRGHSANQTFTDILLEGLGTDGGLIERPVEVTEVLLPHLNPRLQVLTDALVTLGYIPSPASAFLWGTASRVNGQPNDHRCERSRGSCRCPSGRRTCPN